MNEKLTVVNWEDFICGQGWKRTPGAGQVAISALLQIRAPGYRASFILIERSVTEVTKAKIWPRVFRDWLSESFALALLFLCIYIYGNQHQRTMAAKVQVGPAESEQTIPSNIVLN